MTRKIAGKTLVLLTVLVVGTIVPQVWAQWQPGSPPGGSGTQVLTEVEAQVRLLINQFRQQQGLHSLAWNEDLARVARAHSQDMVVRRYLAHTNPEGQSPQDRLNLQYPKSFQMPYENSWGGTYGYDLANTRQVAENIMDSWKSSPPHRQNILNPDSTLMGLGIVSAGQEVRATLIMVQPSPGGATAAQQATVPNVVGMKLDKGKQALAKVQLEIAWISEKASPQDPGTIIEQSLRPGTRVAPGTTLNLVVAARQLVTVPDLVGLNREEARQSLENARLKMGRVEGRASERQEGTVLEQNPQAGLKVPALTAVSLVTAAQELVAVPRVVGLDREQAEEALDRARLKAGRIEERPSEQETGAVLSQNPGAGKRVPRGTSVNLVLAAPELVSVPQVVGLSRPEAQRALETAKLRLGTAADRAAPQETGTVLEQDPAPNTRVASGSAVNLVTAIQETVTVPRVVELSRDEAQQAINRVRLEVGQVDQRASEHQAGTVLEQNPGPGVRVPVGSPVHLVLAVQELVPVPGLVGLSRDEARRRLETGRLSLGELSERASETDVGSVLEQRPRAGQRVPAGSPVHLVVAVQVQEMVAVPDLSGLDLEQVRTLLAQHRLQLGGPQQQKSKLKAGTILSQKPAPGSMIPIGSEVHLVIASPLPVTPISKFWIVIALLAIIAVGYYLYSKMKRSLGKKEEIPQDLPPLSALDIRPHRDLGAQKFDLSAPFHLEVEVRLKPTMDRGQQQVEET